MSSKDNLTKTADFQTGLGEASRWTKAIGIGELSADERELFEFWLDDPKSGRTLFQCRTTLLSLRKLPAESAALLRKKMMGTPIVATWQQHSDSTVITPGRMLVYAAKFLLTPIACKRYVEPVIADMQQEYAEAVAAGRPQHARWIALRVYLLVMPGWLYALIAGRLAALTWRGR